MHQMLYLPTEIVTHTSEPVSQKTHKTLIKKKYTFLIHGCLVNHISVQDVLRHMGIYYLPLCHKVKGPLFSKDKILA